MVCHALSTLNLISLESHVDLFLLIGMLLFLACNVRCGLMIFML